MTHQDRLHEIEYYGYRMHCTDGWAERKTLA
jgi:hypothetical protein